MKEQIEKIRLILNEIENNDIEQENDSVKETFDLFELPQITKDIVDFLQPAISPYEMDTYWFLFRHSVIETGDVFIRASNSKIAKGIGSKYKDPDKQNVRRGEKTAAENLRALEELGIIKKVGDTNRDGTLFRVFLPEEIEICQEKMKSLQIEALPVVDPKKNRIIIT